MHTATATNMGATMVRIFISLVPAQGLRDGASPQVTILLLRRRYVARSLGHALQRVGSRVRCLLVHLAAHRDSSSRGPLRVDSDGSERPRYSRRYAPSLGRVPYVESAA